MAIDLTNTLIVAISATALFDLTESEDYLLQLLKKNPISAVKEFRDYMAERENEPLTIGAGYPLIKALLNLNNYYPEPADSITKTPLVEVVIISKIATYVSEERSGMAAAVANMIIMTFY